MTSVFAITTIRMKKEERRGFPFDARTIGLCTTFTRAEQMVDGNYGDMNEAGYYPWAVIEELSLDCIYPTMGRKQWFRWTGDAEGGYVRCDGKEITEHPDLGGMRVANWSLIG